MTWLLENQSRGPEVVFCEESFGGDGEWERVIFVA